MKKQTDEQLVTNYLKGDEKALEILIKRYLRPIYSFTFRFVGNSQEAEDITQEVFIKVWRNLKKFKPEHKFKTWIFAIAKNTSIDFLKKKKAIPFSEFVEQIPDTHLLPNELLERQDLTNFLNKALEKLSLEYRMILLLRYNDHLTFREIAEILREPLNTIKSKHHRALIKLKKLLNVH